MTKNGGHAMKCKCAECGITKFSFISKSSAQVTGPKSSAQVTGPKIEMNKKSSSGTSPTVQLMDKLPGASETRKVLGTIIPAIIKEKGAKEAFDDFESGKAFKSAWRGISGTQGKYQDELMRKQGFKKMKNVSSKQAAFDSVADDYGPDWHRGGPYEDEWEPYRDSWMRTRGPQYEKKRLRKIIDDRKDLNASQKAALKNKLTGSGVAGAGVDIHKAIGRLPKPKSGWTLPGHKYTGPYNDLENQVRYDNQGNILEICDKPTGKTDAIAMQHDVDYSIC